MASLEASERLVQRYMVTEQEEEVLQLVAGIDAGEWTLLNIIKALGVYLTAEDDAIRLKGLQLLTFVVSRCNHQKLNSKTVRVLATYYCDKLEDPALITPTLTGMLSLCRLGTLEANGAQECMNALSKHVDMREHMQATRHIIFQIVDSLIAIHRQGLKDMGDSFVSAWLKLASGEKDPRNLISVFAIYRVILIEFPIQSHLEDIFENTFCYLPITFRPPPDDPYGISTSDLVVALRSVVTATPEFGSKAVPLFLEKLALGSPSIRRDVMQTLESALPIYGRFVAEKYAEEIWKILKVEIFQPTDNITQRDALGALCSLIGTVYSDLDSTSMSELQGVAKDVCIESAEILREPERSQAAHAVKVVTCLLRGAASICRIVLELTLRPLLKLFVLPERAASRNAILVALSSIIETFKEREKDGDSPDDVSLLLQPYTDDVVGILSVGLQHESTQKLALLALSNGVKIKGWLSDEELGYLIHVINDFSFSENESVSAWTNSIDMWKQLAPILPSALETTTLPLLFSLLPDQSPKQTEPAKRERMWQTLRALEQLCVSPPLFQTLVVRLLAKFDLLCGVRYQDGSVTATTFPDDRDERAAYCHALVFTLGNVLEKKRERLDPDIGKYVTELLERLYNVFIVSSLQHHPQLYVATHVRLLQAAARVGRLITQSLAEPQQATFTDSLFRAFVQSDLGAFPSCQAASNIIAFSPFKVHNSAQHNSVILLTSSLIPIRPTISIPSDEFIFSSLFWTVQTVEDKNVADSMFQALGSIVNRRIEVIPRLLESHLDSFWHQCIADSAVPAERRSRAISGWTWITKGLLVRNHESSKHMIDRLLTLFDDEDLGWEAGLAIGALGAKDEIFTKQNNAILKILHAQKYVRYVLPKLMQGSEQTSG